MIGVRVTKKGIFWGPYHCKHCGHKFFADLTALNEYDLKYDCHGYFWFSQSCPECGARIPFLKIRKNRFRKLKLMNKKSRTPEVNHG